MKDFDTILGLPLLFSGLGVIYLSRFLLRRYPKMTSDDLKHLHPQLEGTLQNYLSYNLATGLGFAGFLFLVYKMNQAFWQERSFLLFVPVFVVFALFDGIFALRTRVFPTTTKINSNSYVYDPDEKLRWVAFWQIGLAILLLLIDCAVFFWSL